MLIVLMALIECLVYPFQAAYGFYEGYLHPVNIILWVTSLLFVLDIISNFFKAVEIADNEFRTDFNYIANYYIKDQFAYDTFIAVPWGFIGTTFFDESLKFLYLIKIVRIYIFFDFFSEKNFKP